MALNANFAKKVIDGKEEEVFNIEFTNGTLKQLKELGEFLKKDKFPISEPGDEAAALKDVVRVGVAWLESVKEERKAKEDSAKE